MCLSPCGKRDIGHRDSEIENIKVQCHEIRHGRSLPRLRRSIRRAFRELSCLRNRPFLSHRKMAQQGRRDSPRRKRRGRDDEAVAVCPESRIFLGPQSIDPFSRKVLTKASMTMPDARRVSKDRMKTGNEDRPFIKAVPGRGRKNEKEKKG